MPQTYEEETRRLLENRKRNAELRRAQQIKKRNRAITILAGAATLFIVVIFLAVSCSSGKKTEKPKATEQKTTTIAATTVVETTVAETTTANTTMYTTDVLNLRKTPSRDADIITQIDTAKKVEVLSEEGEWCKVKSGQDTGYVMKEYLSTEKVTQKSED